VHEAFAPQAFRDKLALRQGPWKIQEARGWNWMQVDAQSDFRRVTNLADDPLEISAAPARPAEAGQAFVRLRKLLDEWAGTQSDPAAAHRAELDEALKVRVGALAEIQSPHPVGAQAPIDAGDGDPPGSDG
jgi:hypothetical protein